jgi:hypothetical protein
MAALSRADLSHFFRTLAEKLPCPVRLILTGGGAAMLFGGTRPTGDIDFGLVLSRNAQPHWHEVERAVTEAAREAKVNVQYASDIDRWSSIAIPGTRQRTRPYRRVGRLSVHLLEPVCWAVYKLGRYLESDVEDLKSVLRRERVDPLRLARLCGESLRTSPRSTALFAFRRQVEHFFSTHGSTIWRTRFDSERTIAAFHRAAQIPEDIR